ncbi:MAG: STAS domain-containing protein [Gemmatimonadota bacterium]|nr:STAS domain-containing protein [Gemmatimonadota bacterium]
MEVQIKSQDDAAAVISVSGDVDLYSSPEVRKAIAALSKKKVPLIVVDLAGVEYMDSSGVATLVEGLRLTGAYNGEFRIASLKPSVREVFELSRLDQVFAIFDSCDQALES